MIESRMQRLLFMASILLGCAFFCGCTETKRTDKPHIFLITVDTLRANHLGCYGYSKDVSKNLDSFADSALLFENCFTNASETRTSFSSILSGFLPHETKVIERAPLAPQVITLPEILKSHGYNTAAVVSNYLLKKKNGFEQGFDYFDDAMDNKETNRGWPERIAENTTDRAIELLDRTSEGPMFMWVHFQDPHGPYTPPDGYAADFKNKDQAPYNLKVNETLSGYGGIPSYTRLKGSTDFHHYVAMYDGEIRYFDDQFKRFVNALKERDLYDDALIIFTSDHGECLGENNFFFCHGENLFKSNTHAPLIIKRGDLYSGRKKEYVQHLDIMPTVLDMLGFNKDPRLRGENVIELDSKPREIFSAMKSLVAENVYRYSLSLDGMKLIYTPCAEFYELYDLKTDPYEAKNLVADKRRLHTLTDLKARLEKTMKEDLLNLRLQIIPHNLSEEERRKLQSLGYNK